MIPPITDHGGVVLVVDDVPRNLQLLANILASRHYEVLLAESGVVALERVAARLPDLILLDLMMPGMDGMEVCRRLKDDPRTMAVPVIFLTAADETGTAARALESGAVDFILKPFNRAELLARVRTHVALKRTRDELQRIIGQKNELMSAVAHDLKNPISAVRFSAMILRDEGLKAPDPRAEIVDNIIEACNGALEFIQQRLEASALASRFEHPIIGRIDLIAVLHDTAQQNVPAAHQKTITLQLDFPDDKEVPVLGEHEALGRVLNNLLSNAIKFTPPGGTVALSFTPAAPGEMVRVRVRDSGPGLTAEDHAHLFEPYRRLSAKPTGGESSTGLGLSIARDLITALGGAIGCEPCSGPGATFWIEVRQA